MLQQYLKNNIKTNERLYNIGECYTVLWQVLEKNLGIVFKNVQAIVPVFM